MSDKRKPLIGVTGSRKRGRIMTFLNRFALWRAGARSIALRPGDEISLDDFDGFVIGGGDDIDPTLYDGKVALDVRIDKDRDELELEVLRRAKEKDLPVLGICRGAQLMNVFFDGTLIHDIHETVPHMPRMRTVLAKKRIETERGSLLDRILGCDICHVNSLHHQAVDKTGRGFVVSARDEHGVVQAIERPSSPLRIGVQWHPEMLVFDRGQLSLFRALVNEASSLALEREGQKVPRNGGTQPSYLSTQG